MGRREYTPLFHTRIFYLLATQNMRDWMPRERPTRMTPAVGTDRVRPLFPLRSPSSALTDAKLRHCQPWGSPTLAIFSTIDTFFPITYIGEAKGRCQGKSCYYGDLFPDWLTAPDDAYWKNFAGAIHMASPTKVIIGFSKMGILEGQPAISQSLHNIKLLSRWVF